jgi:hypothetical protein
MVLFHSAGQPIGPAFLIAFLILRVCLPGRVVLRSKRSAKSIAFARFERRMKEESQKVTRVM